MIKDFELRIDYMSVRLRIKYRLMGGANSWYSKAWRRWKQMERTLVLSVLWRLGVKEALPHKPSYKWVLYAPLFPKTHTPNSQNELHISYTYWSVVHMVSCTYGQFTCSSVPPLRQVIDRSRYVWPQWPGNHIRAKMYDNRPPAWVHNNIIIFQNISYLLLTLWRRCNQFVKSHTAYLWLVPHMEGQFLKGSF